MVWVESVGVKAWLLAKGIQYAEDKQTKMYATGNFSNSTANLLPLGAGCILVC